MMMMILSLPSCVSFPYEGRNYIWFHSTDIGVRACLFCHINYAMPRIMTIDLENEWIGVNQSGDQLWEAKRAEIESAMDHGRDHGIIPL